ncbi:uncharacterized protein METZ01_LOCUS288815 [marine metagenome]|uniref:Uncharacterized protein n=1 Tax=marine metagenome TaxID=408172 RepID=A0A382LM43_9ZZZZ
MATGPPTSVGGNWARAYYAEGIVASGKKLLLVAPAASSPLAREAIGQKLYLVEITFVRRRDI